MKPAVRGGYAFNIYSARLLIQPILSHGYNKDMLLLSHFQGRTVLNGARLDALTELLFSSRNDLNTHQWKHVNMRMCWVVLMRQSCYLPFTAQNASHRMAAAFGPPPPKDKQLSDGCIDDWVAEALMPH